MSSWTLFFTGAKQIQTIITPPPNLALNVILSGKCSWQLIHWIAKKIRHTKVHISTLAVVSSHFQFDIMPLTANLGTFSSEELRDCSHCTEFFCPGTTFRIP
ncbi:hypothetical protein XENORESO_017707 [Xenotaenia resolanae]|uniref:Uncharacterized protein n=1 Tax=Xenotaenia resolanae TaxID=208358 RepID=A0ABV0VRB0_9TELE